MACDAFFEKSIQGRIDEAVKTQKPVSDPLSRPHQLIGAEVWLQGEREEKPLLEGVTRIEFREGEISFQTLLGDEIRVSADIKKSFLLDKGLVLELDAPSTS